MWTNTLVDVPHFRVGLDEVDPLPVDDIVGKCEDKQRRPTRKVFALDPCPELHTVECAVLKADHRATRALDRFSHGGDRLLRWPACAGVTGRGHSRLNAGGGGPHAAGAGG